MGPYTCSNCGKEYAVPPKACSCERSSGPDFSENVEFALVGDDVVSISAKEYSALKKLSGQNPKEDDFRLVRTRSRWGVETADVAHDDIRLTKEEFERCKAWLRDRRKIQGEQK